MTQPQQPQRKKSNTVIGIALVVVGVLILVVSLMRLSQGQLTTGDDARAMGGMLGAFLLPVVMIIVGLVFWLRKPRI